MKQKIPPLGIRLPEDVKAWLQAEAERNGSSQNSEVIRALRAAMSRGERVMAEMTNWDRAADLLGLIHAASFLADDARNYPDAQHGLSAVLNVAQRYAEEICSEAEIAERVKQAGRS